MRIVNSSVRFLGGTCTNIKLTISLIVLIFINFLIFKDRSLHFQFSNLVYVEKWEELNENLKFFDTDQLTNPLINCTLTKTKPEFTVCVHPTNIDIYISKYILEKGYWEKEITELFVKMLKANPNAIFVDIGANIGYYTILSAILGHLTVAVEPVDDQVNRIHKALEIENLKSMVVIVQNAMSDVRMEVVIKKSSNNQGDSRMDDKANTTSTDKSLLVNTILLNDLTPIVSKLNELPKRPKSLKDVFSKSKMISENTLPSVILKIDVQGFEDKVFTKADEFLDQTNVSVIFMEWEVMKLMHHSNTKNQSTEGEKRVEHMMEDLYNRGFLPFSTLPGSFGNALLREKWFEWPYDMLWCQKYLNCF